MFAHSENLAGCVNLSCEIVQVAMEFLLKVNTFNTRNFINRFSLSGCLIPNLEVEERIVKLP